MANKRIKGKYTKLEEKTSQSSGMKYWLVQLGEDAANKYYVRNQNHEWIENTKIGETIIIEIEEGPAGSNQNKMVLAWEVASDITEETVVESEQSQTKKPLVTIEKPASPKGETRIDKRYIVDIKGKNFVTFNGVLDVAHHEGLLELTIVEKNIMPDGVWCIARAKFGDGRIFEAMGSATKENTSMSIGAKYLPEMAQTRAFGRCLRFALNLDMVLKEEIDE